MATILVLCAIALLIIAVMRRQMSKSRKQIAAYKLPAAAKLILSQNVSFYRRLDEAARLAFEERVRDFLARTTITAVGDVVVTDLDRLLVGAAAIIPIFSFPDWRYNNIDEVLLYRDAFNKDYGQQGEGRNIIGMVGDGAMSRQMILSQPALRSSFQYPEDGHNSAIHEFVHLLDKADGAIDGVPEYLLARPYIIPWMEKMRETIAEMRESGDSDINLYAATNDAEFLAVVSEYFFEKPELLEEHHPEIYKLLQQMFLPPEAK